MKLKGLVILLFLPYFGFSQSPDLFGYWKLYEIQIGGVTYHPSEEGGEAQNIFLEIRYDDEFNTTVCKTLSTLITMYNGEESFTVSNYTESGEICDFTENQVFETLYFDTFLKSNLPSNTYPYNIVQIDPPPNELELYNSDGDVAIFFESFLGISNHDVSSSISLFPNPIRNVLNILTQETITKVIFYDVIGKKLLTVIKDFEQIDLTNLPKGLLLVEITTEKGKLTEKVVKQ